MGKSLQDQLLKIGMASEIQAKKAKAEKRKQKKQQNKTTAVDQDKLALQQAALAKVERDRELNRKKMQEAERKAVAAQIKQLIEANKRLQGNEDIPYHFIEDNKVKTIYVDEEIRKQLAKGNLAIVKYDQAYQVVNIETAEKIRLRDDKIVFLQNKAESHVAEDDRYADYEIPDDLIW